MKSETVETYLIDREQFFMQKIILILDEEMGHELSPLEKSHLDVISAFVKELKTIQRMRREWKDFNN